MSMLKKTAGDLAACRKLKRIIVLGVDDLVCSFELTRGKKPALVRRPAYPCELFEAWPTVPFLRQQRFNSLSSMY